LKGAGGCSMVDLTSIAYLKQNSFLALVGVFSNKLPSNLLEKTPTKAKKSIK
jgi:hypothetical protein